jgi:signal peptidase I
MEFYTRKGWGWLAVQTGSMVPLIQPGDQVLINKVMAAHIGCGDIVVFRRGGSMIVHRILKKLHTDKGICFIEKGDNSPSRGIFSADKVIGRVAMVKGNNKLFRLNSPFSRLTSQALSVWFYGTNVIIKKCQSVMGPKVGWLLYLLSVFASNALVRVCSIVWYIAGLHMRSCTESGGNI